MITEPPATQPARPCRATVDLLLRRADPVVRIVGALVGLAGGLLAVAVALILLPLRLETPVGLVRMPAALVFTVAATLVLVWFGRQATGLRWGALFPAAGWLGGVVVALRPTADGSFLLLGDDWLGALTIFAGTAVLTVGVAGALSLARGR